MAFGQIDLGGFIDAAFAPVFDTAGNFRFYQLQSLTPSVTVSFPVIIPVSAAVATTGGPSDWNRVSTWDGAAIRVVDGGVTIRSIGCIVTCPTLLDPAGLIDAFNPSGDGTWYGGPSELQVSIPVADLEILGMKAASISVSPVLKWNVTIPGGANVVMNQPTILEQLSVNSGGVLTIAGGTGGMTVKTDLWNQGEINALAGTVQRVTNGSGGRVSIAGLLSVGDVFTNSGSLAINGDFNGRLVNDGDALWASGAVSGQIQNSSSQFTIDGQVRLGPSTALSNSGLVTQLGNSVLSLDHVLYGTAQGVVYNQAGGVWDLQGDGQIVGGGYGTGGTFYNAGRFEKSAGTGTAVISTPYFENTGTVAVTSGTLAIQNGANRDGGVAFANGGQLQFAGGMQLSGALTGTGDGVLDITGGPTYVADGDAAVIRDFTNGARLRVSGNGWLGATAGGTLTLALTGSSAVEVDGGSLGGTGTTINTGNILWRTGTIRPGNSLTNSGVVTQVGNSLMSLDHNLYGTAQGVVYNQAGGVWDLQGDGQIVGGGYGTGGTFYNAGRFEKSAGTGTAVIGTPYFENTGTVAVTSGTLAIQNGGQGGGTLRSGTWNVYDGATLDLRSAGAIGTNAASVTLSGPTSTFLQFDALTTNLGAFTLLDRRVFTTQGALENAGDIAIRDSGSLLRVNGTYTQTAGTTTLASATLEAPVLNFLGGHLAGNGTLSGDVYVGAGAVVSPGFSPGEIDVTGDFTLDHGASLFLEIAGLTSFDRLMIGGQGLFLGQIDLFFLNFVPSTSDIFRVITAQGGADFTGLDAFVVHGLPQGYAVQQIMAPDGLIISVRSTVTATPEPETYVLVAVGLSVLAAVRARRVRPGTRR